MTNEQSIENQVEAFLNDLGPTAGTVAARLLDLGHKGFASSSDSCPIANYLKAKLGTDDVDVERQSVYIGSAGTWDGEVTLPAAITDFIDDFDDGQFPQLKSI